MVDFKPVNQKEVERAVGSYDFIHKSKCGCGFPIHTFRRPGEHIEGLVRPCNSHDRSDRSKCAHIHYWNQNEVQSVVAIRLTKMLWDAIDKETNEKPKLWGMYIKITYVGSQRTNFGHAKKIYLVERDTGRLTAAYSKIDTKFTANKKPRSRRKISRPI